MRANEHVQGSRDPQHVASIMRWARLHYREDPTQPRDLADFMLRAAETLDGCVSKHWRTIAVVEGLLLCVGAWLVWLRSL